MGSRDCETLWASSMGPLVLWESQAVGNPEQKEAALLWSFSTGHTASSAAMHLLLDACPKKGHVSFPLTAH